MDRWCCTECKLTMHINNRESHLSGARHQAATRLSSGGGSQVAASSESGSPPSLPPGWWKCEICDRAPMIVDNRSSHLRSKAHRSRADNLSSDASSRTVVAKSVWYVCVPCGLAVLSEGKDHHESSATHGIRSTPHGANSVVAGSNNGNSATSGRSGSGGNAGRAGRIRRKNPGGGAGSGGGGGGGAGGGPGGGGGGPGGGGPGGGPAFHPNGQRRIPIRDVKRVHGHLLDIPLEAYSEVLPGRYPSRDTKVTPEQVERASDVWDVRGLLHDIDTQWGLIPGGGAYSDSNFYYGPGEWDCY